MKLDDLREAIWPIFEPFPPDVAREVSEKLKEDIEAVRRITASGNSDIFLEEARRYADAEAERRRSADQKASTYLAVVAALVPLILSVSTAIWDNKAGSAPVWLDMLLLGAAVAYVANAGHWAFKVLKVSTANAMGVSDFVGAAKKQDSTLSLAKREIAFTRYNQSGINTKVDFINLAHAFLLRAFLVFALLLLTNIFFYFGEIARNALKKRDEHRIQTVEKALSMLESAHTIEKQLASQAGWHVLAQACRTSRKQVMQVAGFAKSIGTVPEPDTQRQLKAGVADKVLRREFFLTCGKDQIGLLKVWYIASRLPNSEQGDDPIAPLALPGAAFRLGMVAREWPSTLAKSDGAILPDIVLRQRGTIVKSDGMVVAVTELGITPKAL